MDRINRDAVIAIVLLLFCGVFFWASFDIRQPDYGVLSPAVWPRIILGVLAVLSLLYLAQSVRRGPDEKAADEDRPQNLRQWFSYWRNVFWCFALFFFYLVSLEWLGMLVGGMIFVFLLQGMLGGWSVRNALFHAAVAMLIVGGMWSLFTFGLGVLLPRGLLFVTF